MSETPKGPEARRPGVLNTVKHAVGAFTRGRYDTDKHMRELVKLFIGGGMAGVAVLAILVMAVLQYVSLTKVADSLALYAKKDEELAIEVRGNLDEQRIVAAMERISKHYQPQVQEPKLEPEPASTDPRTPRPKR